jgi:hypothetical protein
MRTSSDPEARLSGVVDYSNFRLILSIGLERSSIAKVVAAIDDELA